MQILVQNYQNETFSASFNADMQAAINILDSTFTNNVTVTIEVSDTFYPGDGSVLPADISEGGINNNLAVNMSYSTLRSDLLADGQPGFFNSTNLPAGTSINGQTNFYVSSSVAANFGIFESGVDGYVGIQSGFTPGAQRISAFLHEIGHALGRVPGTDNSGANSELDLWRFTSLGQHDFDASGNSGPTSYFSLDNGTTNITNWGTNHDTSDFLNNSPFANDPFNESVGNLAQLTTADIEVMEALGFRTGPLVPPAPPSTTCDMTLRRGDGTYEIYNIGNNTILNGTQLGQVGADYQFAGSGVFSVSGDATADMMLRSSTTGSFEVYDIKGNQISGAASLGAVGLDYKVAGFGNFNGPGGGTGMMLRNANTGAFESYVIANNQITQAFAIGAVGLDFQVAGMGDFNGDGTTDMMLRSTSTGQFEVYDIQNSHLAAASNVGSVGLNLQVVGTGDFNGDGTTDMMLRDTNNGTFYVYSMANNAVTGASVIGAVGLDWQVAGFGPISGVGHSDMVLRNTSSGAFEVYDIANNKLTGASSLGAVGTDWVFNALNPHSPTGGPGSPGDGANPGDANAQLVQAMASLPSAAAINQGLLGQGTQDGTQPGSLAASLLQHAA